MAQPGEGILVYIKSVLHPLRNINILFSLASYLLPLLLLINRTRLDYLLKALKKQRLLSILGLYIMFVMVLTDIGGTDVPRFLTYLFIPLVIALVVVQRGHPKPIEIIFMLVAMLVFNRIFWPIPFDSKESFRAFYGGVSTQIDFSTAERTLEMLMFGLIALFIRSSMMSRRFTARVNI